MVQISEDVYADLIRLSKAYTGMTMEKRASHLSGCEKIFVETLVEDSYYKGLQDGIKIACAALKPKTKGRK